MGPPNPRNMHVVRDPPEVANDGASSHGDDELMLLARNGQREAFDSLVVRHQARMLRVAQRLLGDPGAAADAVQNTFLALFGALGDYQARGKFRSYLYRLLLNQCRRMHRGWHLEYRTRSLLPSEPMTSDQLLARERQQEVERALARLPAKQRSVLLMRYTAELGYQEIADALDIPLGTVKSRIFEATARLRAFLEEP